MSYTPGPWEVREGGEEVFGLAVYAPGAHEMDPLAAVDHLDPNEEADARLIASAPDLLEALSDFLVMQWTAREGGWMECQGLLTQDSFKRARTAIAKARGSLTPE